MINDPTPQEFAQLVGIGTREMVATAFRLGITWTLRIGVVTEATSRNQLQVRLDGDNVSIPVTSMLGLVSAGRRVYVMSVPPAGNFAIGGVSWNYPGQQIAITTRTSDSSSFTAETQTDSVTASLIEGRTYKVGSFTLARSTVANDHDLVRIREDSNVGTQLRGARIIIAATGTASDFPLYQETRYTALATGDKTFVLTGQRIAGTGSITHTAGAINPVYLYVEYVE